MNFDHALRFGHFTWMQNCMDDIAPKDLYKVANRAYVVVTSARVLGLPEPLAFDFPFVGSAKELVTIPQITVSCFVVRKSAQAAFSLTTMCTTASAT